MFYFSFLENNKSVESTFAVSLQPYKVSFVEPENFDENEYSNPAPNSDIRLYVLIMSN